MAITMDKLAEMVQNGFNSLGEKIDGVEQRLSDRVDKLEKYTASRFEIVETDLKIIREEIREVKSELERTKINPNEFEDLMGRVKYLEIKLGIESGK